MTFYISRALDVVHYLFPSLDSQELPIHPLINAWSWLHCSFFKKREFPFCQDLSQRNIHNPRLFEGKCLFFLCGGPFLTIIFSFSFFIIILIANPSSFIFILAFSWILMVFYLSSLLFILGFSFSFFFSLSFSFGHSRLFIRNAWFYSSSMSAISRIQGPLILNSMPDKSLHLVILCEPRILTVNQWLVDYIQNMRTTRFVIKKRSAISAVG